MNNDVHRPEDIILYVNEDRERSITSLIEVVSSPKSDPLEPKIDTRERSMFIQHLARQPKVCQ